MVKEIHIKEYVGENRTQINYINNNTQTPSE